VIFNARAGYRFDNGMRLQLDVLNLFNAQTNQSNTIICRACRASRSAASPTSRPSRRTAPVRLTLAGRF